tara:strand:- start:249 stop:941 length:693 start_codon:yes stop_codon:yes gene_type:complete
MGFKLKSGNRTNFKSMGSSPAKDMKTGSYKQSFESPAKQKNEKVSKEMQNKMAEVKAANLAETNKILKSQGKPPVEQIKESPAKQRLTKGGEAQDQDKIFDAKGNHIGNWVNDKKVMFNDKPVKDKSLTPEPKKKKSPAKQTKDTFADGSKKSARDKFNDRETALEQRKADREDNQKSQYWYKINGKKATRAEYIKYQNKPGGDEPGKQTNDPDVYGRIKSNHGRGPKTK